MKMTFEEDLLKDTLYLLCTAQNHFSLLDYINIWGEELGNHIWQQEGSDLLRIWRSGLTQEQAQNFIRYILDRCWEKES